MIIPFKNLTFDIQSANDVLIEKFKEPTIAADGTFEWRDEYDNLHSYNGFPSLIRVKSNTECQMLWSNHGRSFKSLIIDTEEKNIIANKKKNRKFT